MLRYADLGSERKSTPRGSTGLLVYLLYLEQTTLLFRRHQTDAPPVAHNGGQFMNTPLHSCPLLWLTLACPPTAAPWKHFPNELPVTSSYLCSALEKTQVKKVLHTEIPKLLSAHPSQGKIMQLSLSLIYPVCVCVLALSCVQLFVIPWSAVCHAPLSMEFSRQEYWSGLHFLLHRGKMSLMSPALAGRFFTRTTWEAPIYPPLIQ